MTLLQKIRVCGSFPILRLVLSASTLWIIPAGVFLTAPSLAHAQQLAAASTGDPATVVPTPAPMPSGEDPAADAANQNPANAANPSGQEPSPTALAPATTRIDIEPPYRKTRKEPPESEIAIKGMVSYGNWVIFAAGEHEEVYTAGVEYDRNSWGHFAGAQMDYAADFMPLVLLDEPAKLGPYGNRLSKKKVTLHGLAFSPIGLRMQWRHDKAFKPYLTVLGGAIGFTKKALSPDGSYYDFTLHETIGFYLKMTQRVDMRFGLFGDFHFSNAYVTNYNPGLDVMNSQIALSYHLGRRASSF